MAKQAVTSISLQYTPPSAAVNSGAVSYSTTTNYNAQNVGQIDINPIDAVPTTWVVPFGSVGQAKVVMIQNSTSADVTVRLNAHGADDFKLSSGASFIYSAPTAPAGIMISAVSVITTAAPAVTENVNFWVIGD